MIEKIVLLFYILKGGDIMAIVMVYVTLILDDEITFERVPKKIKQQVKDTLFSMGYDENGNLIKQ